MFINRGEKSFNLEFYSENMPERLANISKTVAPYSKILLLSSNDDFIKVGLETINALKRAGHKVITALYPCDCNFSVNTVCGLFTAPEDVRLIISLSENLSPLADYFSAVRQTFVITLLSGWTDQIARVKLFIKNGDGVDFFNCPTEKTVLLKYAFINKVDAFCYVAEKKFQLFDYYVRTLYTGEEFNRDGVNIIREILDDVEKMILSSGNYFDIDCAVGEAVARTAILAQRLLGEPLTLIASQACKNSQIKVRFLMAKQVLRLTERVLCGERLELPDYSVRVTSVSVAFGFSKRQVLDELKTQTKIFNENNAVDFKAEFYKAKEYFDNAFVTAQKLGLSASRLNPKQLSALKIAGDTPFGINLMSVCREISR